MAGLPSDPVRLNIYRAPKGDGTVIELRPANRDSAFGVHIRRREYRLSGFRLWTDPSFRGSSLAPLQSREGVPEGVHPELFLISRNQDYVSKDFQRWTALATLAASSTFRDQWRNGIAAQGN
jgi:hypothetical protein